MSNKKELARLKKRFEGVERDVARKVEEIIESNAQECATNAKKMAPIHDGDLRESIYVTEPAEGNKGYEITRYVVVGADHGPYVEFGTKARANPPAEWESFALQFRGPSNRKGAYDRIMKWAMRKGLKKGHAFNVFMKIMRYGMHPQPFLYPAFTKQKKQLMADLRSALKF